MYADLCANDGDPRKEAEKVKLLLYTTSVLYTVADAEEENVEIV